MPARRSLFRSALLEAHRHKYLESEKAGHDLGPGAIDEWQQRYWTRYVRYRWLEHLLGEACYEEFDPAVCGRLRVLFPGSPLLEEVVEQIRHGAENLNILCWAVAEGRDLPTVKHLLAEIRINEIRCTRFCVRFARGQL